jgi:superfamily I DNA/RNA helicase
MEASKVSVNTIHLAEEYEFKAVIFITCDEDIFPSTESIVAVRDEAVLEAVFDTERNLIFVDCTSERRHLLILE